MGSKKMSGWPFYLVMLGMMFAGSCNTILTKLQGDMYALGARYKHSFFQCFLMFLGELTCLVAYGIKRFFEKRRQKNMTESERAARNAELATDYINPLLLLIPALFDFTASTISLFALTQVAASVY